MFRTWSLATTLVLSTACGRTSLSGEVTELAMGGVYGSGGAVTGSSTMACVARQAAGAASVVSGTSTGAGNGAALAVAQVSLGNDSSNSVLLTDGRVMSWGPTLDLPDLPHNTPPRFISGLSNVTQLSQGFFDVCALLADRTVRCWGVNGRGEVGSGMEVGPVESPVAVVGLSGVAQVSIELQACAVMLDGTVACWGANDRGALGNGTTIDSSVPVVVQNLSDAVEVTTGFLHSCARLKDGRVRCWGSGGSLGDGTTIDSYYPTFVAGLSDAVQVIANDKTCALRCNGTVVCWPQSETSDSDVTGELTPIAVSGLSTVIQIAVGSSSCALLADRTVKCWGKNDGGQLGNGTTVDSWEPVKVLGLSNVVQIAASSDGACSLLEDGTVKCWGYVMVDASGSGTWGTSLVPIALPGLP